MRNTPFLVAVIIIILGAMGFAIYHSQASSKLSSKEQTIASLESQATSLGSQITTANTKITELQTEALTNSAQISLLQSNLSTANDNANSL